MNQSRIEKIVLYSQFLGKEMPMNVFLPQNCSILKHLPVLYFLHGRSGNEDIIHFSGLANAANVLIDKNEIQPMIIVCPRMDNSRGLNSSRNYKEVFEKTNSLILNLGMYEDYLIKEVIPFIDQNFKTLNNRNARFIGGASAGGYTALHNAFRHQDMFCKVGGHMPAIELELADEDKIYFSDIADWNEYDPLYIAQNMEINKSIKVYLDAGNNDEGKFYEGCSVLYNTLIEKNICCQNFVFDGNHSVEYIQSNIEKYLKFYAS